MHFTVFDFLSGILSTLTSKMEIASLIASFQTTLTTFSGDAMRDPSESASAEQLIKETSQLYLFLSTSEDTNYLNIR